MANERLILAIGQMERALTRLETVQGRIGQMEPACDQQSDSGLAARHARLKSAAAEALSDIDALLAKHG
jgi:hypothetical protein